MVSELMNKLVNKNLRVIYNIISSYFISLSEWYFSYILATILSLLFVLIIGGILFIGGSILIDFLIGLFIILVAIHVYMSFKAIFHDYIYNRYIIIICNNLLLLLIIGMTVEILFN